MTAVRSITSAPVAFSRLRACDGVMSWSTSTASMLSPERLQLIELSASNHSRGIERPPLLGKRADDLDPERPTQPDQLGNRGLKRLVVDVEKLNGDQGGTNGSGRAFDHWGREV